MFGDTIIIYMSALAFFAGSMLAFPCPLRIFLYTLGFRLLLSSSEALHEEVDAKLREEVTRVLRDTELQLKKSEGSFQALQRRAT